MENFNDRFKNHISKNRGKYALGAGVGTTLGGIKLGGEGYLGTDVQDTIHDLAMPISNNLKVSSIEQGTKASVDPYFDVYKKTDNVFNGAENEKLLNVEKVLQKENIPAISNNFGEKLVSNLTGLNQSEKLNYLLRNPISGTGMKYDELTAPIRGTRASIGDAILDSTDIIGK